MELEEVIIDSIAYKKPPNEHCLLILCTVNKQLKIPISIGAFETESILTGLDVDTLPKTKRPLTHDLMKNIIDSFELSLQKIIISDFTEGNFYAQLVIENNGVNKTIDSRPSDAIAIAIRLDIPIFINKSILKQIGFKKSITKSIKKNTVKKSGTKTSTLETDKLNNISTSNLKKALKEMVEVEDYEKAVKIRDELNKRLI